MKKNPLPVRKYFTASILCGAALVACTSGEAQAGMSDEQLIEAADGYLLRNLTKGTVREQYLAAAARPLRDVDRDGDGLDETDIARVLAQAEARQRAGRANRLLQLDYDGDLKVTRAEIIKYSSRDTQTKREEEADLQIKMFDRNGDGVATLAEAIIAGEEEALRRDPQFSNIMELDVPKDGRLTASELMKAAGRVFDHFDEDRDGTIGAAEFEVLREYQRNIAERQLLVARGCIYPKASRNAQLVAYGVYESDVLSTAFVGSPDTETGVIDVVIEPGSRPLYLVLSSYDAMIWRFSGATDRIERIVASSYETGGKTQQSRALRPGKPKQVQSAVAAIGVPADRFVAVGSSCMRGGWRIRDGERDGPDRIADMIGKRPMEVVAGEYAPVRVSLPSTKVTKAERRDLPAPKGFDPAMWKEALRFSPGGIERIDPKKLVTSEPVGDYKIMPEQFGIAQLLSRGALVRASEGRFLLTREIAHWPSGLAGAHSVNFIVKDGVKLPEGRPGHSCVMSEADAKNPDWKADCLKRIMPRTQDAVPERLETPPPVRPIN